MLLHILTEFWLPILASAIAVFFASSLLWAVLPWHRNDYGPLPDEDAAQAGLGEGLSPGLYALPFAPTPKDMEQEAVKQRMERGPMALITVLPPDAFAMGKRFVQWFAYNLLVAFFCALLLELASLGLAADDPHWTGILVHVTGIVTFLAYGGAYVVEGIWFSRTWPVVGKYLFDAAVYAALTAVIFLLLA